MNITRLLRKNSELKYRDCHTYTYAYTHIRLARLGLFSVTCNTLVIKYYFHGLS